MNDKSDLDGWLKGLSQIVNETLWRDWDPCDVNDEQNTKAATFSEDANTPLTD